ncbi:MAG: diguanylate cyclase [Deltaproteobacteria bacterium]|nr:diguanylate cyclase [Deltaproteobacteria bacterium]
MTSSIQKILLLTTDPFVRQLVGASILSHPDWKHCHVESIGSLRKAMGELSVADYEMILVDCPAFEHSPLELLIQLRGLRRETPIILFNRPGVEKTAIACLKNGADYYLPKNKNWEEELPHVMDSVLEERKQKNNLKGRLFQLERENRELRQNTAMDKETAFYSMRHFQTLLSRELHRANRYGLHLACLILDLQTSDKSLHSVCEKLGLILRSTVRSCDIWGRLNEEQFAALMPHTTAKQARQAIKRLDSEIAGAEFLVDKTRVPVKVKWGIANFSKEKIKNETDFLRMAEASLARAS